MYEEISQENKEKMNPIDEARKELKLNNPDYRMVCGMLVDAIEQFKTPYLSEIRRKDAEEYEANLHIHNPPELHGRQSLPPETPKPSPPPPPPPKRKK
jgi:hypothetical protein